MVAALALAVVQGLTTARIAKDIDSAMRVAAIRQYSIYAIEPTTLFRSAMTPERFRSSYDARRDATSHFYPERMKSFVDALKKSKIANHGGSIDVRIGISVKNAQGNEIYWICIDGFGRLASINGYVYEIESGVIGKWMLSTGKEVSRSP